MTIDKPRAQAVAPDMTTALDDRDIAILRILTRDGRISKSELARRVNLSASPCWERLRRLESAGIIRGYKAEIALGELGPHVTVFVMAELERHRAEDFRAFETAMSEREEVTGCWGLGGGFDYLLQVVTTDIDAYQRLVDDLLIAGIGLRRYFTYIVTNTVKTGAPPPLELLAGAQKD